MPRCAPAFSTELKAAFIGSLPEADRDGVGSMPRRLGGDRTAQVHARAGRGDERLGIADTVSRYRACRIARR